jgi:hypothetical protein
MDNDQIIGDLKVTREMKKGNYVQIPNKIFAFDSEYFMTNDELSVYFMLCRMVSARNHQKVECNIELINSKIDFRYSDESKNKNIIKKALTGLHEKKYIILSFSDDKLNNNTLLSVYIAKIYSEVVMSGNLKFKGYTEVYDDMYDACKGNIQHLKVLIYVDWRSQIGFDIPLSQWEKVLDVSNKTAVKILDECITAKIINKERGQYYVENGKPRQETNSYSVVSEEDREIKEDIKPSFTKKVNTMVNASMRREESNEQRSHKLFGNDKLNGNDYFVWITTECPILKEHGNKRFNAIANKSEGGKNLVASWKKEAENCLKQEKRLKNQQDVSDSSFKASIDDREYIYKAKKGTDYSHLFDDAHDEVIKDSWLEDLDDENEEDYEEVEKPVIEDFVSRQKRRTAEINSRFSEDEYELDEAFG